MIAVTRIDSTFGRWGELLALIRSSFAYMDGLIDPPSSAHRLTEPSLAQKALDEIAFAAASHGALLGCVFLRPEPGCLYVGKLAVAPTAQGQGIGRSLLEAAEDAARTLSLPALRLETRIQLAANHAAFTRLGFHRTAERSHPGYREVTFIEMRKDLA